MTKSASRCRERRPENEVSGLPYHHDWKPLFETSLGLRVKWFGRWGGDPNWFIEPSRLGAELQDLLKPEREGGDNAKTVHHVLKAQDWMQERLGEEITVQAWAEASGLNTDYFSRLFKTHTGMAPRAWLIEARLQRASRTLASSDAAIAEVSAISGFNCPFHFSRTFKKRFGIPPAKYRKLHQLQSLSPT